MSSWQVVPAPDYTKAISDYGLKLGDRLADLPNRYFQGTQQARTLAEQNAFPDGMPVLKYASGNPVKDQYGNPLPDMNAINNTNFKLGGYDYAKGLMSLFQGQNVSAHQDQIDSAIRGYGTPNPSADNKSAAGPGNIILPRQQQSNPGQPSQPRLAASGGDIGNGPGADTIRSIVTEFAGGKEATPIISNTVRTLRIHPDAPLSADQVAKIKSFLSGANGQGPRSSEDVTPQPEDFERK